MYFWRDLKSIFSNRVPAFDRCLSDKIITEKEKLHLSKAVSYDIILTFGVHTVEQSQKTLCFDPQIMPLRERRRYLKVLPISEKSFYKDTEPEKTIAYIRQFLNEAGIFASEKVWFDGFNTVYSCRLEIQNTGLGVNGKGNTILYALASAYGELLERLQTHMIFMNLNLGNFKENMYFRFDPRELIYETKNLQPLPASFKRSFMFEDEYSTFDYWRDIYLNSNASEEIIYLPFYDIQYETEIYLPADIVYMMAGSNGMCAGNTKYEALSQGLSEILERYVMKKIYFGMDTIGTVPESHLKKYFSNEYELIKKIQQNNNFIFEVKDCTFGGKYPVMAVVVRDIEQNRYAVCFGADPDIRIALQRCITEIFQGSLTLIEKSHQYNLTLPADVNYIDYNEQLKNSSGKWTYFILQNTQKAFPRPITFNSSEEKYNKLIEIINNCSTSNIYVRDCSLGEFKVYQIIIPGLSEAFVHSKLRKVTRQKMVLTSILSESVTKAEARSACLELQISNQMEYGNKLYWLDYCKLSINGAEMPLTWQYLLFVLSLKTMQLEQACAWLKAHNENAQNQCDSLIQAYHYICLLINGVEKDQAISSLEKIFGKKEINIMKQIIEKPFENIVVNLKGIKEFEDACKDVYLKIKQMQLKHYMGEA